MKYMHIHCPITLLIRISKRTVKKTSDELKVNRATTKEKNAVDSRQSAVKLFGKTKHMKTPSPLPITTNDISEATHKRTSINLPSNSSTSIDSDSMKQKRNSKHRSFVESYNVSKEYSIQKSNNPPSRKPSNRNKSPAKSKLVLENVRKMIKDQHVQQQHFNHNQQKESVRL